MNILIARSWCKTFDWLKESLEDLGHCVEMVNDLDPQSTIEEAVDRLNPHFVIANNFDLFYARGNRGYFESYFEKKKIPVVTWFYEAPSIIGSFENTLQWEEGPWPKNMLCLTIDSQLVPYFKKRSLPVEYVPFACDSRMKDFRPNPLFQKKHATDLSYIGSLYFDPPLPLKDSSTSIQNYFCDVFRNFLVQAPPSLAPDMNAQELAVSSDAQNVQALVGFFRTVFVDRQKYFLARDVLLQQVTAYMPERLRRATLPGIRARLDTVFSFSQQCVYLHTLNKQIPVRLSGKGSWSKVLPGISSVGERVPDEELNDAYCAAKVVFNFTKFFFPAEVHERTFHVLAAGGFPLGDQTGDYSLHFEEGEVATYRTIDEAIDLARFYINHDSLRLAMIERGRTRVLKDHTYHHRAKQIVSLAQKYFGIRDNKVADTVSSRKSAALLLSDHAPLSQKAFEFARDRFNIVYVCHSPRQTKKLPEEALTTLSSNPPDYIFNFLSPVILSNQILETAKIAAINFHPAPPDYPGVGSASRALYDGAKHFGSTAHFMTKAVDAGEIIRVHRFEIDSRWNCSELWDAGLADCFELYKQLLHEISCGLPLSRSNERWKSKAMSRKDFEAWMTLPPEASDLEREKMIRACRHPRLAGPFQRDASGEIHLL